MVRNDVPYEAPTVTGTLIAPRLVLTCGHFLKNEIKQCYSVLVDTNSISDDIHHGVEFNIDPKSKALIVKEIKSSRFETTGLQIGDVIKKMVYISVSDNMALTEITHKMYGTNFKNQINHFCTLKNMGQIKWEWHIERQAVLSTNNLYTLCFVLFSD